MMVFVIMVFHKLI